MGSLNDSMVRAAKLGRLAADRQGRAGLWPAVMAEAGATRSQGAAGRLALDAFREFGVDGMRVVMTGYGAGYNRRTLHADSVREGAA